MKRLVIFAALIAIVCTFMAALINPHFGLLLVGIAILGVLWRMAGGIAETSEEYETEARDVD
jgi:hypothetical protein